jgi:hypothetical protein
VRELEVRPESRKPQCRWQIDQLVGRLLELERRIVVIEQLRGGRRSVQQRAHPDQKNERTNDGHVPSSQQGQIQRLSGQKAAGGGCGIYLLRKGLRLK